MNLSIQSIIQFWPCSLIFGGSLQYKIEVRSSISETESEKKVTEGLL